MIAAMKQLYAKLFFQLHQLPRQSRLCNVQNGSRFGNVFFPGDH